MKFNDIISSQDSNSSNSEGQESKKAERPFFNGKIDEEVIIHYPHFKVIEKGEYRSLMCFGNYHTPDGKDTTYSLSIIITHKSIDHKDINDASRRNLQRLYMVAMALIPNDIDPNKEYMSYYDLLDSITSLLNTKVKGKDIRLNVESNEFKGRYYYYIKDGLSIVSTQNTTVASNKQFPDIEATISRELKAGIPNIYSTLSSQVEPTKEEEVSDSQHNVYKSIETIIPSPSPQGDASSSDIQSSYEDLPF